MTTKQKPAAPAKRKQGGKKPAAPTAARIDPELRRYCAKRKAAMAAEHKKAVAEGRVQELVKYDPKTGKGTLRTVTA